MSTPLAANEYYRSAKDRLSDAREFLQHAKREIADGRAGADTRLLRQGAEKAFHALVEACAARIQKGGLKNPKSHDDTRMALDLLHEKRLMDVYEAAFARLHTLTYYKGWIENDKIDEQVMAVEKAIAYVEKKLRR